jgi:CHAT domain-containing protein
MLVAHPPGEHTGLDSMMPRILRWINLSTCLPRLISYRIGVAIIALLIAAWTPCRGLDASAQPRARKAATKPNADYSEAKLSVDAAAAFAEAENLRKKWKAASIRESIKKYYEAFSHWRAVSNPLGQARALKAIGDAYAILSENSKRLNCYEQALKLVRSARDSKAEVDALTDIANAYIELGESIKAFEFCNQALARSREIGYRKGEAASLNATGSAHYTVGDLQKALEILPQALSLWHELEDHPGQAQTLMNIGYAYDDSGDIHKALDAYTESLEHSKKAGDRQGEALAMSAIGGVQTWLGEKQRALDYHNETVKLFREMGFKNGEAATWNNIAAVYEDLGEIQKALEAYSRALHLYQAAKQRSYEALTTGYIGKMYLLLGDEKKALEKFNQKLLISRALSDNRMEAYTLKDMGAAFESQGNKLQALGYYNRALNLHLAGSDRRGQAYTLNAIGQTYDDLGDKAKAIRYYKEAFQLIKVAEDRGGEVITLFNIARAERDLGNLNESRSHIETALNSVESLRARLVNQEMRASYFAHVHKYYEFYIDLLMSLCKQQGSDSLAAAAFEVSERARARILLEILAEAQADIRRGVDIELLERERLLRQQIDAKAEYNARLLYNPASAEQLAELKQELEGLLDSYQQVQAQIRAKSPVYAELVQPAPLSLVEIQQQVLDVDTMMLQYSLGEERSYLWAITQSSITSFELPARAEIERVARGMLETIVAYELGPNQPVSQIRSRIKQAEAHYWRRASVLSQMLLRPVASQLGKKRLLIISEGILQYVPFAALPEPDMNSSESAQSAGNDLAATPILVNHEIISLPSASVLGMLRRQIANRAPAKKAIAVMADPVFDQNDSRIKTGGDEAGTINQAQSRSGRIKKAFQRRSRTRSGMSLPRLLSTRREANAILAWAPDQEVMKALGFKASRATALSSEVSQYRIVHIATHGLLDSEHPELSSIVLSMVDERGQPQNGFLRLHDIYNLNLPAELIVLSACSTALGKDIKGEGLIGLTRGFMYAGAARVVSSLWQVDDEATAELMGLFYQKMLKENMRPAAALRSAQLEVMNKKRWHVPYYWASFILQGDWN